jgi:hypothetical protein
MAFRVEHALPPSPAWRGEARLAEATFPVAWGLAVSAALVSVKNLLPADGTTLKELNRSSSNRRTWTFSLHPAV